MRRNWKWLVGVLLLLSVCAAGVMFTASASGEKSLAIEAKTLSLENEVQIKYAVSETGFTDAENIHLLVWMSAQTDYTAGTEDRVLDALYTDTVGEKKCVIFAFDGFSAKQMADTVFVRAYGSEDGETCYSDVCEYSVLQYVLHQLNDPEIDDDTKDVLTAMLDYGAAAQKQFRYKVFSPANRICRVETVNGAFDDGGTARVLAFDTEVTLVADPAPEGEMFVHWVNRAGEVVGRTARLSLTVDGEDTYTAIYTPIGSGYSTGLEYYDLADGTCIVNGVGSCTDPVLKIPPLSPSGNLVTDIAPYAFQNLTTLTEVVLPDSVDTIGVCAFAGCTALQSVNIPYGVTGLHMTFSGCTGLTAVELPESLKFIGDSTFGNCVSLTGIVIPDGVTDIFGSAFEGCSSLASVRLPVSLTSIGADAFRKCISLEVVIIPGGVTSIGSDAFSDCTSLTTAVISEGVTAMGQYMFSNCSALRNVILPETLTGIGESAFMYCTGLMSLFIPDNVTAVGNGAFHGCTGLVNVVFSCNSRCQTIEHAAFSDSALTEFTIPASVVTIDDSAFLGCVELKTLTFAAGSRCAYIRDSAFSNTGLTSVTIPEGVTTVDSFAFYGCEELETVNFAGNSRCQTIELFAFSNCCRLTNITIPEGVTDIGENAFDRCIRLASITIPDSVTSIGDCAFRECVMLESVTIPDSVTSIGEDAFRSCPCLVTVNKIQYLGAWMIGSDSAVATAEIREGTKAIADFAFTFCDSLTSVMIPSSMTNIGRNAFNYCINLTDIVFLGTQEQWNAIEKGENWDKSTGDFVIHCTDGDIAK